jgi:large subunit ribosomal protein L11
MSKTGAKTFLLKLAIPSGGASPSPPIGPALGQRGIKAIDFCRAFNDASTKLYPPGTPVQCTVQCRPDRTFEFHVRPPATSWLVKRAAGIAKASSSHEVARVPVQIAYEIARIKAEDPVMKHIPLRRIFDMVVGSAKTFGITFL